MLGVQGKAVARSGCKIGGRCPAGPAVIVPVCGQSRSRIVVRGCVPVSAAINTVLKALERYVVCLRVPALPVDGDNTGSISSLADLGRRNDVISRVPANRLRGDGIGDDHVDLADPGDTAGGMKNADFKGINVRIGPGKPGPGLALLRPGSAKTLQVAIYIQGIGSYPSIAEPDLGSGCPASLHNGIDRYCGHGRPCGKKTFVIKVEHLPVVIVFCILNITGSNSSSCRSSKGIRRLVVHAVPVVRATGNQGKRIFTAVSRRVQGKVARITFLQTT